MEPHRTDRDGPRIPTLEPGRTLGSLLILNTLSVSPRSTIYMARDLALDRPVALKAAPRGTTSVIAEGRVLARLSHPHIVTLYGLWAQPAILVLEYLVGETLKVRHERLKVFPRTLVIQWLEALLTALEAVHEQGFAHGAIRSENIFLTTDQGIKLLDFRQTTLGEAPPTPADDIRATGHLLSALLGHPIPNDPLTAIAHDATCGYYPTARALRLALTRPQDLVNTDKHPIKPDDTDPFQTTRSSSTTTPTEVSEPTWPATAPIDILTAENILSINPILPVFNERSTRNSKPHSRKSLGFIFGALFITAILLVTEEWPHRRTITPHATHLSHTVSPVIGNPLRSPVPARHKTTTAAMKPTHASLQSGVYAALAHAWGD